MHNLTCKIQTISSSFHGRGGTLVWARTVRWGTGRPTGQWSTEPALLLQDQAAIAFSQRSSAQRVLRGQDWHTDIRHSPSWALLPQLDYGQSWLCLWSGTRGNRKCLAHTKFSPRKTVTKTTKLKRRVYWILEVFTPVIFKNAHHKYFQNNRLYKIYNILCVRVNISSGRLSTFAS